MNTLLTTVALGVALMANPALGGWSCYSHQSDSPILPGLAKSYELSYAFENNFTCTKVYEQVREFHMISGAYLDTKVSYSWYHKQCLAPKLVPEKCGDVIEDSFVMSWPGINVTSVTYRRYCTCCGQNCNGPEMNDKCTEEPVYTHQCYGDDRIRATPDHTLPSHARLINCTANQRCFKSAVMDRTSNYAWGCATYPSVTTACNIPLLYYHPQGSGYYGKPPHYDKVCTCCGDECNGKGLDGATVNNTYCGPPIAPKRTCFSGGSTTGKLPDDAVNFTLSYMDQEGSACVKMYQIETEYDLVTGLYIGKKTSYSWFHKQFAWTELLPQKCGDVIEESYMTTARGINKTRHYYQRMCTCCGENCNGPQMDDQCNEEPKFTHNCYSNDRSTSPPGHVLSVSARPVQCTANQQCFKSAIVDQFGTYNWGCASYPSAKSKCGHAYIYNHPATPGPAGRPAHIDKVCTCCGDLCNKEELDGTTVNNTHCLPASRQCYEAYDRKLPTLPADAEKVTEQFMDQRKSACVKVFERSYDFNTKTGEFLGTDVTYNWYAKDFFQPSELLPEQCGDVIEESDFRLSDDISTVYYTRRCSCCGDNCNGHEMDNKCNEEPEFTHECYADDRSKGVFNIHPELPRTARSVYCTAKQQCYKSALELPLSSSYHWGCANYPKAKPVDKSLIYIHPAGKYVDQHVDKICLCEGHLCNGLFDEVTSNNTLCTLTKTTTTLAPSTTTKGTGSASNVQNFGNTWLSIVAIIAFLHTNA